MVTFQQIAYSCIQAIDRGAKRLTFVLPGYPSGNTRRLLGRKGPRGEVVCDSNGPDGEPECLVAFDPKKVLTYLMDHGLVTPTETPRVKTRGE